jgi:hypothetical protein
MGKAIVEDELGKVNFPSENLTSKMIKLVRKVTDEVASKFPGGELEIYGHLKTESRVGVMYIPPKKHWYNFSTARAFMSFKNEGIKELLVKVSPDPKYISDDLVAKVKKIITKNAIKLNIKIKFN